MRTVLEEKLKLDGVEWDELVLKDNVRQPAARALPGAARAGRLQAARSCWRAALDAPVEAEEVLFGDDAEADAFIYSLYADLIAGRVDERGAAARCSRRPQVYPDDRDAHRRRRGRPIPPADPVRRIFIHLDRLTPPAHFARYGPRVVPIFNYFQAALVLMADGHLTRAAGGAGRGRDGADRRVQPPHAVQLVPGPAAPRAAAPGRRRRALARGAAGARRRCSRRCGRCRTSSRRSPGGSPRSGPPPPPPERADHRLPERPRRRAPADPPCAEAPLTRA